MALLLRQARGDRSAMPREVVDMIYDHWDRGTSRAVLTLYRGADPERLAEAGRDLERIECPALVLWGERDPYLPSRFGRLYAERLPNAEYVGVPGAGHWPWIDSPQVVERVLAFLGQPYF
jgi:pimeloyl-ACP methyl ester carboxylesterase